ncbi:HAMP domain-containing histidine kinase [Stakelama sp. CBK3Z-3]|uniref:histidine kinase n=1 Tax=Stakelama flava TaxID=2860338 RepID=A0ABS6XGG1_9SPHN|nr:ATP-binding protein [Stakelama flava]MBW4329309.1 HAMP domain-containing histidine kinase [Stakelama flava]
MLEIPPPAVTARTDLQGILIEADNRIAELNRTAGGDIGKPVAVPQLAALVRLALRLRIVLSRQIVAADGESDVELWVRVEPDDTGLSLQVSGWRDHRDWPVVEDAAQESDFAQADADWLWETDSALRITALSREAGAKYGFDADELLGRPLTRLFALSDDEGGEFPILDALASHGRFDGQVAQLRGSARKVYLAANPRTDATGRFIGFDGAARLIDDSSHGAEPEGTAQTHDDPATAVDSAFGARLEKALRGPLGRIIANADSIRSQSDGPLRQDYADYAADIANAGRHLLGLVEDLVDLQAIERDDFDVAVEAVDLADVARRAAGLLTLRAQHAKVTIDAPKTDEGLPATGEFRRALQVLVNLIGNAVRHSPAGAMIWIRAERDGDRACLIVADQGAGIAEDDQARIFEKFERLDTADSGGSGLGLYIARRLARAMGGDVTVDSAPGQGARFIFTLPGRD